MTPYYEADGVSLFHGDCRDFGCASVPLVLADPPYGETSLAWDRLAARRLEERRARQWALEFGSVAKDSGGSLPSAGG